MTPLRWEELERYVPTEPGIPGPIDNAHATAADLGDDLVVRDRPTDQRVVRVVAHDGTRMRAQFLYYVIAADAGQLGAEKTRQLAHDRGAMRGVATWRMPCHSHHGGA